VSDSKIIVLGGYNEKVGNLKTVFLVDLSDGKVELLSDLQSPGWTVSPIYYLNGVLNMFQTCEETDSMPDHVIYKINIPLN
jgi:hypothetical protein